MSPRWLWALAAVCPGLLLAQVSLAPPTGLNPGPVYGPVTKTIVSATGSGFSQAVRLQTTRQPAQFYDAGYTLPTVAAVAQNDVIAGQIWLRRLQPAAGEAYVAFNFEKASPNYDKSHQVTWTLASTNWVRFRFAFPAVAAYSAGAAQLALHLGFPPQTVEMGGLQLTNYAKLYPLSAFTNDLTYVGREPEAPWRAEAAARIEQHRKADLTLTVRDLAGKPVAGAPVVVRQVRHAFGFGSAVDGARLIGRVGSTTDMRRYQEVVTNWFNEVVMENDLKWPQWETGSNTTLSALGWLKNRNIGVRGHNLIWPGDRFLPPDVPGLYGDPAALRRRIENHFRDVLAKSQGLCFEWDVINEPLHETSVEAVLGRAELAEWFKLARNLDRVPRLYLNEYNNIESPDRLGTLALRTLLQDLKSRGATIDGVGVQGHFGGFLTSPPEIYQRIQLLTPEGGGSMTSVAVTEFDVNVADELVQADYLRDFFTIVFSHPRVERLLMWGFWANQHWLPRAALIRSNWELKPNGIQYSNLVFREWWTTTNGVTDASGRLTVRGFKGDYVVQVGTGSEQQTAPASLRENAALEVTLPVTVPGLQWGTVGGRTVLRWPRSAAGYRLQHCPDLDPAVWQPVATTPVAVGDDWQVELGPDSMEGFYRLGL